MRFFQWLAALLLMICVGAAPARAEVYQWVDERGNLHMTDDLSQVPAAHRLAAELSPLKSKPRSAERWNAIGPDPNQPARLTVAPSEAKEPASAKRHVLYVEPAGDRLRVAATLNGSVKAPFIVDTGATGCTIQRWVVDKLGIPIDARTRREWVVGISGEPMEVPIVMVDEVGSRCRNVTARSVLPVVRCL